MHSCKIPYEDKWHGRCPCLPVQQPFLILPCYHLTPFQLGWYKGQVLGTSGKEFSFLPNKREVCEEKNLWSLPPTFLLGMLSCENQLLGDLAAVFQTCCPHIGMNDKAQECKESWSLMPSLNFQDESEHLLPDYLLDEKWSWLKTLKMRYSITCSWTHFNWYKTFEYLYSSCERLGGGFWFWCFGNATIWFYLQLQNHLKLLMASRYFQSKGNFWIVQSASVESLVSLKCSLGDYLNHPKLA